MDRKFGTVLVMCVILEVTLCAPVPDFESSQSLEEVSAERNHYIYIFTKIKAPLTHYKVQIFVL
jgi:hypothetical protein